MRLIDADALKESLNNKKVVGRFNTIQLIDNAPAVERPQGDLANEVWKLYEKHHSHLATHVIEFGDELKELLGRYAR